MWLICECAGAICAILTYVIVLVVQWGLVRVGLWEGLQAGESRAYWHLAIFQYHCLMIFWSHFKCMTTEPGVLPKLYEKLDFAKISPDLRGALVAVEKEVKVLEAEVQEVADKALQEEQKRPGSDAAAQEQIDPRRQSLEEIEAILRKSKSNLVHAKPLCRHRPGEGVKE